jgi:hypothetical protein
VLIRIGLLLIVVAALAIWTFRGDGSSVASGSSGGPEAAESLAIAAGTLDPQFAVLSRAPASQEATAVEAVASSAGPDPAQAILTGGIRGMVLTTALQPVARTPVGLARLDGIHERKFGSTTNDEGHFEVLEVPVGKWRARVHVPGPRRTMSSVDCGEIEIFAGQVNWLELRMPGDRSVTGRLLEPESDSLVVHLMLVHADDPSCIAAEGDTVIDAELQREEERRVANPDHWREEDSREIPMGRLSGEFWMGGLVPGQYRLRIYWDAQRIYWIESEVDLRNGDADLGTLRLDFEEFARAKLERDPELLRAIELEVHRQRQAGVERPEIDLEEIKRQLGRPAGP